MKHWITLALTLALAPIKSQTIVVLGTLQDGGSPHMNCEKSCCATPKPNDYVACLGVYDSALAVLFDATPDIVPQLGEILERSGSKKYAVFLTHAHMGHYTGLAHFGREAANTSKVPVYAMPKMIDFLAKNGPWNQLLKLQNITLNALEHRVPRTLKNGLIVEPFLVPHRDEFSETVGYFIKKTGGKVALYIPDIDKWEEWEENIIAVIPRVDYAFIDGTFFADGEVPRPMAEVPHPFISESAHLFSFLPREEREKIYFIHLNHSNPARNPDFEGRTALEAEGMHFATFGQEFAL